MKNELKALKERIECDSEFPLTAEMNAYLEQIQSADDLKNFTDGGNGDLVALAYDAALALGLSEIQARIISGELPADSEETIEVFYRDGEYLWGYSLHGEEAKFLESIGLARHIDGWGYHVKDAVIEKLGQKFTRLQARELAQPAIDAKKFSEDAEKAAHERVFSEAARTGKPVVLDSYSDECNDPREECDLDHVTVYAMPDGSTKESRSHTW
jgi:hypothetical protein